VFLARAAPPGVVNGLWDETSCHWLNFEGLARQASLSLPLHVVVVSQSSRSLTRPGVVTSSKSSASNSRASKTSGRVQGLSIRIAASYLASRLSAAVTPASVALISMQPSGFCTCKVTVTLLAPPGQLWGRRASAAAAEATSQSPRLRPLDSATKNVCWAAIKVLLPPVRW